MSEINANCFTTPNKVLAIYFKIRSAGSITVANPVSAKLENSLTIYDFRDTLRCTYDLPGTAQAVVTFANNAATDCRIYNSATGSYDFSEALTLNDIYTADVNEFIGIEIYE